jgi:hypothetical protein
MFLTADDIAHFTSIFGFTVAMPLTIATYYQSFKTRQEARDEREGTLHSMNCLEFVTHPAHHARLTKAVAQVSSLND